MKQRLIILLLFCGIFSVAWFLFPGDTGVYTVEEVTRARENSYVDAHQKLTEGFTSDFVPREVSSIIADMFILCMQAQWSGHIETFDGEPETVKRLYDEDTIYCLKETYE